MQNDPVIPSRNDPDWVHQNNQFRVKKMNDVWAIGELWTVSQMVEEVNKQIRESREQASKLGSVAQGSERLDSNYDNDGWIMGWFEWVEGNTYTLSDDPAMGPVIGYIFHILHNALTHAQIEATPSWLEFQRTVDTVVEKRKMEEQSHNGE